MDTTRGFFLRKVAGIIFVALAAMSLVACGAKSEAARPNNAQSNDAVRVASKADTEGALLGNMMILLLESKGIPTVNKIQLGSTKIVRYALMDGEIDIYPEYTGSVYTFSDDKNPAWKNAQAAYDLGKKLDYDNYKVVWLNAAPANNTWAIAVRSELAVANNLKTIEDLAKYIEAGKPFKMATSAEFIERGDALPLFEKAYGFKLKPQHFLPLAGGDTNVFIKAAADKSSGANAALVYGTDGGFASAGLVVLEDSKGAQPIFAPVPTVREAVLKKYPQIADVLNPVFSTLDLKTLQQLNGSISEGRDAKVVAEEYLKAKGFLK